MSSEAIRTLLIRADRVHAMSGDPARPADAVWVEGSRVRGVGAWEELRSAAPWAEPIDLRGTTITPGLTDSHVHLVEWALSRTDVDLSMAASRDEAAMLVAARARSGDGWIRGRGWDPNRWALPPHRDVLDRLVPDRPVLLQSHDMHSLWGNGRALWAAGIERETPDPPGGRIERDADGRPTGVVRDNAMPLLLRAAPDRGWAERRAALLDAQPALHRSGITGVHTVEPDSLGLLDSIRADGELRVRVLQHLAKDRMDDAIRLGLRSGFGGPWIRIGGIKIFLDGALGSRTAWMRAPYERSSDRGLITLEEDEFRDLVQRGSAAGLAMTVHAIGDAANDLALDVLPAEGGSLQGPVPHRIEHVQLLGADRIGHRSLGRVICSVQPSHLMTDWRAADAHWGRRARYAYAFRSMLDAGATLALGSDAPVEPPDPRLGLYAAVARRDSAGAPTEAWYPEERLTTLEALHGFTVGAALAAGDRRQGRLGPGTFADLVAWDRDPLEASPEELLEMTCTRTIVGGEPVWSDT